MKFGTVRQKHLELWQSETGRNCGELKDDIMDSFECDWQRKSIKRHVSIFCSFGVWVRAYSQFLMDERFDNLDFRDKDAEETLYSHYNMVLLIVSELLSDQERMIDEASGERLAKKLMKVQTGYAWHDLRGFINNVVKHKGENSGGSSFHFCNHHMVVRFEDDPKTRKNAKAIFVGNLKSLDTKKSLIMPSLGKIHSLIIESYRAIDKILEENESYLRLASNYEKT